MRTTGAPGGVLASIPTPFDASGSPDVGALTGLIDAYAAMPIQGLFLLGTAGEAMLLTPEEREGIVETVMGQVADPASVLVHCGTADTVTTIRLARHAVASGATSIAAIAPYYFQYGPAQLEMHYRALAESVPEASVYIYDNPGRVGYSVGVPTVIRLTANVPNVLGVKDTGDSIGRVTRYLSSDPDIHVYVGNNELINPSLVIGCRGAVSALAGAMPELVGATYNEWVAGRFTEALQLQFTIAKIMACLEGLPYLGSLKWLARHRGLPAGFMRAPQSDLDEADGASLLDRLDGVADVSEWLTPIEA